MTRNEPTEPQRATRALNPDLPGVPDAQPSETPSLVPSVHHALAEVKRAAGDELGALAHLIAAHTLDTWQAGSGHERGQTTALCNVATGYFMKGDHAIAAHWYRLVLALDPEVAIACQNLAAIHANDGQTALADQYRERAYRIQRVFVEQAAGQQRRVLVLCAARSTGNVPFEALLPGSVNCRIKYAIDYAADDEDAQLPTYDLVFNAIGDPDIAAPLAGRLSRFVSRCERPLLNSPEAVARTSRNSLETLLGELTDVQTAPCIQCDTPPASQAELTTLLTRNRIAFPVLVRPAATHGGEGLARVDDIAALANHLHTQREAQYITAFRDSCSTDGHYRKYRMIFVDRKPYPYHLAISRHWMVHYFSADMQVHAWKLDEERRFLADPRTALGERAINAIEAIGHRLDLDYGGIDLTLLPDGQVLIFEANATMLVHFEREPGPLAHKNPHVQSIVDAFERMMARRTAV